MGFLGSRASSLSDVSLVLLVAAAVLITLAWRSAVRRDGTRHHALMILGVATAWFFFLTYMANRLYHIASGTPVADFGGPAAWRRAWWIPLIVVHSSAATIVLLWSLAQVWSGYRRARKSEGRWRMSANDRPRHAATGRGFLAVWYLTTATGILVYLSLYVLW